MYACYTVCRCRDTLNSAHMFLLCVYVFLASGPVEAHAVAYALAKQLQTRTLQHDPEMVQGEPKIR